MKFLIAFLVAIITFSTANAAKVDTYRDILSSKVFTLKYRFDSMMVLSAQQTYIRGLSNALNNKIFAEMEKLQNNLKTGGVVVLNKDDSYFENYSEHTVKKDDSEETKIVYNGQSTLVNNGETFVFFSDLKDGTKRYFTYGTFGLKSSKVKATNEDKPGAFDQQISVYEKLFQDYTYGNLYLNQALAAILPPEQIIMTPNTPIFEFVGAGNINGLNYEDFFGEKNNYHCAIRYYFDGDKLVRIALFDYIKDQDTVQSYEKYAIDIDEFSDVADKEYLQLPENLRDVTKRDEDGKK